MSDVYKINLPKSRVFRRGVRPSRLFKQHIRNQLELAVVPPSNYLHLNSFSLSNMSGYQKMVGLEKCPYCGKTKPNEKNNELTLAERKGLSCITVFNSLITLAEQQELDVVRMELMQKMLRADRPAAMMTAKVATPVATGKVHPVYMPVNSAYPGMLWPRPKIVKPTLKM